MEVKSNRQKWVAVTAGSLIVLYCMIALSYIVISPDLRLRCLLADDDAGPWGTLGVEIRDTSGVVSKGEHPHPGDILLSIGERRVNTFIDFARALHELRSLPTPPGGLMIAGTDPSERPDMHPSLVEEDGGRRLVRIQFWRKDSDDSLDRDLLESYVEIQSLPLGEIVLSVVWFMLQLGIFAVSALAVWYRPFDRPARVFFAMCLVTMGAFVGGFHWWVIAGSLWLNIPFALCALLVPAVSLHFFLIYPQVRGRVAAWPRLTFTGLYAVPTMAAVALLTTMAYHQSLAAGEPTRESIVQLSQSLQWLRLGIYAYLGFAVLCFVSMLAALAHGFVITRNPIERNQMRWMLAAGIAAAGFVGYTLYLAMYDRVAFALGRARVPMFLASLSFMAAYAVGIVRFKLMLADQIVSKGMRYYVASCGLTVLYGGLIALTSLVAKNFLMQTISTQQVLVAVILVLIVILLLWLRDRIQQMIDRRFYREKYQLDKAFQRMNRAVGHLLDRQSLAHRMLVSCLDVLGVEFAAVYLRDSGRGTFQLIASEQAESIPLQFTPEEGFLERLRHDTTLQRIGPAIRGSKSVVQNTLRSLHADLLHALESDGNVAGFVILGPKKNGASFTAEDLTFLSALGQITSVALHSVKIHQDLARLNEELQLKVDKISEQKRQIAMMQAELIRTHAPAPIIAPTDFRRDSIKGDSPAIRRVLETVRKVSTSESSVLIRGESGTGKELLAQALHENSPRQSGPLVRVHCAALSPSLLESELFGHVKGAFTGAHRDRVGRFEMAHGGTLFLDEIGDISLETQIKLLRVLQQRAFEPVGGTRTVEVDVRLITATHQDLESLIDAGRFREDLYYRLNVISITLPPLRERKDDILELAFHFLKRSCERIGKRITHIDEDALEALRCHHWPGNIRELENVIERAVVLAEDEEILLRDLPPEIARPQSSPPTRVIETKPAVKPVRGDETVPMVSRAKSLDSFDGEHERAVLERALRECGGNKAEAARKLGMPRSTYYSKLKKYSIA